LKPYKKLESSRDFVRKLSICNIIDLLGYSKAKEYLLLYNGIFTESHLKGQDLSASGEMFCTYIKLILQGIMVIGLEVLLGDTFPFLPSNYFLTG
jgi:hypothetical protein